MAVLTSTDDLNIMY